MRQKLFTDSVKLLYFFLYEGYTDRRMDQDTKMKLIIAEKPMLARAIASALPGTETKKNGYSVKGEYTIVAAFGHLLTLKEPEDYDSAKYKRWALSALPIYFDNWGKKPGEGKKERLDLIGELLKNADEVIHAGDPDDEGQYLIDEILQWFNYKGPVKRLSTRDTTDTALKKALDNMGDNRDFESSGLAAHARSVADIMVGYNFSRYFSLKNPHVKMLTVGRVQTPTLGLVVNRDLTIENHRKLCYYTVSARLDINGEKITAKFEPGKNDPHLSEGKLTDKDYADHLVSSLGKRHFDNAEVTKKEFIEQPPLPFNLVKLQTYCSAKFGYDPTKTLEITQALRDDFNAITYNRSDCQFLSEEQYAESPATIRQVLENLDGTRPGVLFRSLPLDGSLHSKAFDDRNITAHTAIIPQRKRFDTGKLSPEQLNVYLAIIKYYMAQFLEPAKKERTALEIPFENGALKASSMKILSPGFMKLIRPEKNKDSEEDTEGETELSSIPEGTYEAICNHAASEAKETKAPPRYTKASLNEDMTRIAKYVTNPEAKALLLAKDKEKKGENGSIGTSATRSFIIDNLEARGFIETKGKQIRSTVLGRELYRILPEELKKPDMTGLWWAVQESIKEGQQPWTALTDSVLDMIKNVLAADYPKVDSFLIPESMRRGPLPLGPCPRCGAMVIEGKQDYGCSAYSRGCRFIIRKKASKGMMSRTELTPDMIHTLLTSGWTDETKRDDTGNEISTERKRTRACIDLKNLYSETKGSTFAARVYLTDNPKGTFEAGFAVEQFLQAESENLGKCPRCGRPVTEGKLGFGCSGFKEGCSFSIWKNSRQKLLANITFTKSDAKKFLAGKSVKKKKLLDKKGREFTAELVMVEEPDNPYGPVFRVIEGTIDAKDIANADIRTETIKVK